jgi:hypothetical protein
VTGVAALAQLRDYLKSAVRLARLAFQAILEASALMSGLFLFNSTVFNGP